MTRACAMLLAGIGLALSQLAAGQETERQALEASQAQWTAAGITNYRYGYQKYCECHRDEPPETVVIVADGAVDRVYHRHADSAREVPAREGSLDLYWTMEELFGLIEGALNGELDLRVRYDAELGYPLALYIDYDPGFIGEELDLRSIHVELED